MLGASSAQAQGDCASAVSLAAPGTTLVDTTATGNTLAAGCDSDPGNDGQDFWVALTGLTAGNLYTVQTAPNGSVTDTTVEIWEGVDCASAAPIACDEDASPTGFFSLVSFTAQSGMSYWAFTETQFSDPDGTWDLSIDAGVAPPANSTCDLAGSTGPATTVAVDTTATADFTTASLCGGGTDGNDFWVAFTGLTDGNQYTVETSNASLPNSDTVIEIYEGVDCASATPLVCNGDIDAGNFLSRVSFIAQAGMNYWALTESEFGDGDGTWDLRDRKSVV